MLLLGAMIGLGAATAVEHEPSAPMAAIQPMAVRVVDGDTFWLGRDKIRIADIDTPELRARCPAEAALAAQATARLRVLLADGRFELHGDDTDRYGRKLRTVVRDGRSVGGMLVAEGLARDWTGQREPWCA